jgi:thioredoxin 1
MTHLNETTFDPAVARGVAVIEFSAPWCPPCRMLEPLFARAAAALSDRATFATVDADASPALLQRFRVMALPSVLVLRDGHPIHIIRGLRDERSLIEEISHAIEDRA